MAIHLSSGAVNDVISLDLIKRWCWLNSVWATRFLPRFIRHKNNAPLPHLLSLEDDKHVLFRVDGDSHFLAVATFFFMGD